MAALAEAAQGVGHTDLHDMRSGSLLLLHSFFGVSPVCVTCVSRASMRAAPVASREGPSVCAYWSRDDDARPDCCRQRASLTWRM
jgi:hypothetical protein